MYYRRKIDDFLIKWKKESLRRPLIIRGAGRVGKTQSVLHFAREHYKNVVYIDFAKDSQYRAIVSNGNDVDRVLNNISLANPLARFEPGETVIIFDEIQEYPEVAGVLKHFRLDRRFDVIAITSMTSLSYKLNTAASVRNRTDYDMYSMDFEEFLWAKGYTESHMASILNHMSNAVPFDAMEMNVYKMLFETYCQIGGLPEVVKAYMDTGDMEESLQLLDQISEEYEQHICAHAQERGKAISVYRSIPQQLNKENKKFQFKLLDKNARAREYEASIRWLLDAGMLVKSSCLEYPKLPLRGNLSEKKYKLYCPDSGLFMADMKPDKYDIPENTMAEMFVKQGLPLCYYKKDNSTLELAFLLKTRTELIPVEINPNNKSKALSTMIEDKEYRDINVGIRFGDYNISLKNQIYSFPYFCGFMMKAFLKERR